MVLVALVQSVGRAEAERCSLKLTRVFWMLKVMGVEVFLVLQDMTGGKVKCKPSPLHIFQGRPPSELPYGWVSTGSS